MFYKSYKYHWNTIPLNQFRFLLFKSYTCSKHKLLDFDIFTFQLIQSKSVGNCSTTNIKVLLISTCLSKVLLLCIHVFLFQLFKPARNTNFHTNITDYSNGIIFMLVLLAEGQLKLVCYICVCVRINSIRTVTKSVKYRFKFERDE